MARNNVAFKSVLDALLWTALLVSGAHSELNGQSVLTPQKRAELNEQWISGQHRTLDLLLAETSGDVEMGPYQEYSNSLLWNTPDKISESMGCNSNAIIIASLRSSKSQPTGVRSTIYTTWMMQAEDVLKEAAKRSVPASSSFEVITNGGTVLIDGRRVTVVDPRFPVLERGNRYLMFLRLIEPTGAFFPWLIVDVTHDSPVAFPRKVFPKFEAVATDDYLTTLKDVTVPATLTGLCQKGAW